MEAGRPIRKAVAISPAAEITTAITINTITSQTPRLLANVTSSKGPPPFVRRLPLLFTIIR
jgi:hypothetical protein